MDVLNISFGLEFFQIGFSQQAAAGVGVGHDTGIYFGNGKSGFDFGLYTTGTGVGGTNVGVDAAGVMFSWSWGNVENLAGTSGGYEVGGDLLFLDTTFAQEFTDAGDVVTCSGQLKPGIVLGGIWWF